MMTGAYQTDQTLAATVPPPSSLLVVKPGLGRPVDAHAPGREAQRVLVPSIMNSSDVRLTYANLIDILPVLRYINRWRRRGKGHNLAKVPSGDTKGHP